MIRHILKKTLYSILVVFGVISLIFALFNLIPGDPARMVMGQHTDSASLEAARRDMGLDLPKSMQFFKYLNDISPISIDLPNQPRSPFHLDTSIYGKIHSVIAIGNLEIVLKAPYLRRSYQSKQPVATIIARTLPNTLVLALSAIIIATVIGILLGIVAAFTQNSAIDKSLLTLSALGMSLPSFFAAIVIGWIFAYLLGDFTGLNLTGNLWVIDDLGESVHLELKNLILPSVTLGIRPLSVILQLTRSSTIETMEQDYIRTARAKGLNQRKIILNHILRNSLNPVITAISGWFASLMAGVIFIEYIFGWKGLGYIMVNALNSYDVPLVIGCVITIAVIFSIINLLVDIGYSMLDPRIKFS